MSDLSTVEIEKCFDGVEGEGYSADSARAELDDLKSKIAELENGPYTKYGLKGIIEINFRQTKIFETTEKIFVKMAANGLSHYAGELIETYAYRKAIELHEHLDRCRKIDK
jgi:hypothetical protein